MRGQIARRQPLPAAFLNLEMEDESLQIFTRAFNELDTERVREKDRIHPITRRMVMDWLEWYGWQHDTEFKSDLIVIVTALDRVWMKFEAERLRKAAIAAAKAANRPPRKS